jgi:hypothetical protein
LTSKIKTLEKELREEIIKSTRLLHKKSKKEKIVNKLGRKLNAHNNKKLNSVLAFPYDFPIKEEDEFEPNQSTLKFELTYEDNITNPHSDREMQEELKTPAKDPNSIKRTNKQKPHIASYSLSAFELNHFEHAHKNILEDLGEAVNNYITNISQLSLNHNPSSNLLSHSYIPFKKGLARSHSTSAFSSTSHYHPRNYSIPHSPSLLHFNYLPSSSLHNPHYSNTLFNYNQNDSNEHSFVHLTSFPINLGIPA